MYFTIMRPEFVNKVSQFSGGLAVVIGNETLEHRAVLVVKVPKEMILTAHLRKGLSFYLAPCEARGCPGLTLISAFFDDPDNPLTITTPLIAGDPLTSALSELPDEFDICFFDEHNRELLSCVAVASLARFRSTIRKNTHLTANDVATMMDQAELWFSMRSTEDDGQAYSIVLGKELFPSNFVHYDLRDDQHAFHGSPGFSTSTLIRGEPGPPQERDIIFLLQRIFAASQIIHGPIKVSDRDELVDVAVLGDEVNLMVQAKDSPNTEKMLDRSLDRKRRVSLNQLEEGLSQLGGACSTIRREPVQDLKLVTGGKLKLDFSNKPVVGVVIVRELFADMYDQYSERALGFVDKYNVPVIFFDYPEFDVMTRHCPSEDALLSAFYTIFKFAKNNQVYPKLRFD